MCTLSYLVSVWEFENWKKRDEIKHLRSSKIITTRLRIELEKKREKILESSKDNYSETKKENR